MAQAPAVRQNTLPAQPYCYPPAKRQCRSCRSAAALASPGAEAVAGPAAESFLRPHLRNLAAYAPIEPFEVLSARLGRRPEDIVKLDANENPYGPPDAVRRALGSLKFPHIYPDPETRRLRSALAEINNIPMENLLVRHWQLCLSTSPAHGLACLVNRLEVEILSCHKASPVGLLAPLAALRGH